MKKPLSYYVGNSLIALSLLGFIYIGYPILFVFLFPSSIPPTTSRAFSLWIPKIHAAGKIIPNVDPWNETEYKTALKNGIALGKGFALPNQSGITYLFAHSSGLPWEITHYNTVFLRLGELDKGDKITIWYLSKQYDYQVIDKKVVDPTDVTAVTGEKGDELIIQTCTPIGTDWQRLLIYAKKV
ncbi:hypothetical protein BH09PAT1_BH09PAT1_0530 [soil metagenome]